MTKQLILQSSGMLLILALAWFAGSWFYPLAAASIAVMLIVYFGDKRKKYSRFPGENKGLVRQKI